MLMFLLTRFLPFFFFFFTNNCILYLVFRRHPEYQEHLFFGLVLLR
jgi:hypothetical protein